MSKIFSTTSHFDLCLLALDQVAGRSDHIDTTPHRNQAEHRHPSTPGHHRHSTRSLLGLSFFLLLPLDYITSAQATSPSSMSQANPTSYQPTRTPSPQPPSNQSQNQDYTPNGRPTSQILSNSKVNQSLGLPQQQQPNTVGTTSTARFSTGGIGMGMFGTSQPGVTSGQSLRSDGGNNNNNSNGSGAASYSNERPSNTSSNANTANRHVSLAAGMGGGSGNGQQPHQPQPQHQQQGNGNVGDRLATARAVSPRLPGSAGPGSNQFPIYSGAANGLLQGSSTNQGLGGLGLGAAPGARPGAGVRPASEYLGGGNKGQRGKEASPESEFRSEADHLPSSKYRIVERVLR